MSDTFTKDQVIAAYNNAPDYMRAVFNDEKTTRLVIELQKRFQLHTDVAGILGQELGYLLLGLTNPDKFMIRLKANGFDDQIINQTVIEINKSIFLPLRERLRSGEFSSATKSAVPQMPRVNPVIAQVPRYVPPARPTPPTPTPPPAPMPEPEPLREARKVEIPMPSYYAPPLQSPRYIRTETKLPTDNTEQPILNTGRAPVAHGAPLPPKGAMPRPSPGISPAPRQIDSARLLEDHEEPHIEFRSGTAPTTAAKTAPPPSNLPGVLPNPANADARPSTPAAPARPPYSADPYREPVE